MIRRALHALAIAASLAVLALAAWRGRQLLSAVARPPVPPADRGDSSRLSAEGGGVDREGTESGKGASDGEGEPGGEVPAAGRRGATGHEASAAEAEGAT